MPFIETDNEIVKWSNEYDTLCNEYREILLKAETLRDAYDLAKARAMLKAPQDYKVDEKKAHVVIACHEQAVDTHTAEATREWFKERLKTLSGLLNAAQSRAAREREELKLQNFKP